jgi:hypothetical protein
MSSKEEIMQVIRENRSSESNFNTLLEQLEKATTWAQQENNSELATELHEVKEKYVPEYQKAKDNAGTAWPEFEKFVTQFERSLTKTAKSN